MTAKSKAVIKHRSVRNESEKMVRSTRSGETNNEGLKKRRAQLAELSNTIRETLSKIPRQFFLARLYVLILAIGINPPVTNLYVRII